MVHTIRIGKLKNEHCSLGELLIRVAGSCVGDVLEAVHDADVLKSAADSVVDNAVLAESYIHVRSLTGKDRGKKRTAGDHLEVYRDTGLGSKVVVDKVTDDLRLVTSLCEPYLDRASVLDLGSATCGCSYG